MIGINIGSRNTSIGTYDKGIFKLILSETSSRTIPTVVSYGGLERCFGDIAFNKNRANFKSTILYINRWLGMKQEHSSLFDEEAKYANISPKTNQNNNLLGFDLNIRGKKVFYLPESIMGSFFNKIKSLWLRDNINTNNVVVSIPDFSTIQERKAMMDSIYISGLNCTALLNESSAISINYAFQKLKELEDKKRTVAFIDLGHSQLTIFYAEFTKKNINIMSVSSERFCGARDFDYLIAEKLTYEFQIKYGIDPLDSPKAKISLLNAINKARKELTVNQESKIIIDEIIKGKDLVHNLTRKQMEEMINPVLLKFENLCLNSLIKAQKLGVDINNLHSIEMVGDTLRMPCLLKIIKDVFKKDLSKTLIPDECISKGCTLFAMMNSPHYKLQNFEIKHYNNYPIMLECQGRDVEVFREGESFPLAKTINIPSSDFDFSGADFNLRIVYKDIPELNYIKNKVIHEYKILLPYPNKEPILRVEIHYSLDINGISRLNKVLMVITENNVKELNYEMISENFGLPKDGLDILKLEESENDKKDLNIKEANDYKNSIEEYIYKTRDKINDKGELVGYFTQQEKEALIEKMDNLMKFLYSENEDLYNKIKLEEKSLEMKQISEPIYSRYNAWKQLRQYYKKMESLITEKLLFYTDLEDKIKKGERKDMSLEDLINIQQLIQKEFNNLELKLYEYDNEQKTQMPKVTINDVQNMIDNFNVNIEKIKNKNN